ncbi:hypothetical protein COCC4DRAFT_25001 [Bipolaris maydis ATCC 48331]|uniref:Uncharacterized protein n=2 Tax=Cochliobolus heterostrophus TaxID=5016 RepID=M2UIH3_COCH5|nr:uncharacterized protein COCC4DRAFT_25001 [Bipolaris maydis ATCC 48331]EMD87793.1 hypothetical protein COCHEDRAFT_1216916 [Bipolaris maydis C5]KAH7552056.1 hypothetical protein BM1_08918 [Bipolaris maydis]ENI03306.1 hypothetical protein COCC4DRAFT_25001 [Bipolaris maydis ATCC 48331]KAJ5024091.1 hypothetical protein J3E73DRAFT_372016 [Bipolaris maydis]KAJ5057481.1 hypothetical protein J3E74DRAFT_222113 [Bipolaris maydis]
MKAFFFLALLAPVFALPANQDCNSGKAAAVIGGGGAANATCAATKAQLEKGIQDNLNIQAQELQGVKTLQAQLGTAEFKTTQAKVLNIQQRGIEIRANNQKLAKEISSPALDGLNIVQGAQITEQDQVKGLKNQAATDTDTLNTLVQEVTDGTAQNQKNLAAAKTTNC